jgi:hypothetical protein
MGGLLVDCNHRTSIENLYAVGECASMYHGANRLGGNSLLAAIYSGKVATKNIKDLPKIDQYPDFSKYVLEQEKIIETQPVQHGVFGMPGVAVRGKVIFPNVITSIDVGRLKSLAAVNASIKGDRLIFLVCQKDIKVDNPTIHDLYEVGVVCKVGNLAKVANENFRLTIEGLYRAKITNALDSGDFLTFNVEKQ